jgi:2',3'-cyclic-nucleotide 2'-phosphodiesterase (5'-nucleotidase family)
VLAFPDEEIALLSLKGSQLAEALERGLALVPRPNKGFLQVAGVAVQFDRRRPPESRVLQIVVEERRLEADKVYKVAMPVSLARGALGYFRVFNGVPPAATGATLADALTQFFAARSVISIKAGTRLLDVGAPPPNP